MKHSTITEMTSSHAKEFRFLVECLKSGKLPVLDGPIKIFEPSVVESKEQLYHGVVRAACQMNRTGFTGDDLVPIMRRE